MTELQWTAFLTAKAAYRSAVDELKARLPQLQALQQTLVNQRPGQTFLVETSVVYNRALDDIRPEDELGLILVADNPGRREQAASQRRYLVGPSGKLAENFFRLHPDLKIDFRRHVLILNKTPIHTARTAELRELGRLGGNMISEAIDESQRTMASLIRDFHQALSPLDGPVKPLPLWIIGYSELAPGKLFSPFRSAFNSVYSQTERAELRESIGLFRHFSMNQFTIDFKRQALPTESTAETLKRIGLFYRQRYFGW